MTPLYPLRFEPIFRRYLWGGRRLATVLGKNLGKGDDYAESWEIVDHGEDQSIVAAGPLKGTTLHELVADRGMELLGRCHPQPVFPLLLKFLDAHKTLSVQVHPDDAAAAKLDPPDLGKSEAWYVLAAEEGGFIYAGLKRGFDRAALQRELARGTAELCLHKLEPSPGDCVLLEAGAVHALGAGLMVAEIQQASDATFRLYDFNRLGKDGQPRELHIERGLAAIDYQRGEINPQTPQPTDLEHVARLAACDKFILDRWQFDHSKIAGGDDRFHILAVIEGEVAVEGDPAERPLVRGESMLLPAAVGVVQLAPSGDAVLLDAYLP